MELLNEEQRKPGATDSFEKYSRLMLLIAGAFIGFILFVALVFFILKYFAFSLIHIPGFDKLYQFVIVIIPYIVFFAAYFYLFGKIKSSHFKTPKIIARILIFVGALFNLAAMCLSIFAFANSLKQWLLVVEENEHYAYILQLIILLITAAVLASGDKKEEDWMERRKV